MRIRLIRIPTDPEATVFDLTGFRVGEIYDVGPRLAEYLMANGCAEPIDAMPRAEASDRPRHRRS